MNQNASRKPDPERQIQARRYAQLQRRLIPLGLGLGLAWTLGLLFSGAAVELRRALTDLTNSQVWVVTLFTAVTGVGYALSTATRPSASGLLRPGQQLNIPITFRQTRALVNAPKRLNFIHFRV